jgi:putative transposase
MREHGIRAKAKRKFKATTDSQHKLPVAPNRLAQDFSVAAPNRVWLADITYCRTREGWLYVACVLDLSNREIVGWAMKERMTRDLVMDALTMAWFRKHPAPGLIHHSDRGSQYCGHDFQALLGRYGMLAPMSGTGNCFDSADGKLLAQPQSGTGARQRLRNASASEGRHLQLPRNVL